MTKIIQILINEYRSTVMTKAFIFGAIIFPALFYSLMFIIPSIVNSEPPQLKGKIVIYNATNTDVAEFIENEFDPVSLDKQKEELKKFRDNSDGREELYKKAKELGGPTAGLAVAIAGSGGNPLLNQPTPDINFEVIYKDNNTDLAAIRQQKQDQVLNNEIIAYIELDTNALDSLAKEQIQIFTGSKIHPDNLNGIQYGVTQGIIKTRVDGFGFNLVNTQMMLVPPRIVSKTVTAEGETNTIAEAAIFVPLAFMMLLWISTFTGGQYLLMSTVEEKSSRVMEVMLSAVSSMQMMTGKIFGQGAVAFTMLAIYVTFSLLALKNFDKLYLIDFQSLIIFIPYFFMAFMFIACIMAAVGSAVSDVREASAMLTPAMMILIIPFLVMMPVIQSPNSVLATTLSFIPPLTPFIMAMRLGSNQDIAIWQIVATLIIGFSAVILAVKLTAKIFRIGVLMYGKPPNLKTLLKWVWQA